MFFHETIAEWLLPWRKPSDNNPREICLHLLLPKKITGCCSTLFLKEIAFLWLHFFFSKIPAACFSLRMTVFYSHSAANSQIDLSEIPQDVSMRKIFSYFGFHRERQFPNIFYQCVGVFKPCGISLESWMYNIFNKALQVGCLRFYCLITSSSLICKLD